ncbi:oleosin 18.2 kDa [Phtheirospermum japonicum]|uniref:Oleosin 18.2 kDa n=1 Tax=Phtheirospermum japonicum TaxID=374723 RepID=A0A830CK94_9LAMI|nr:oleosin 18.2 kDa [Phtheirospermum japonicum]
MAERDRPQPHQIHVHPQAQHRYEGGVKDLLPRKGPSATQILAVVTLLPVGGSLLGLAGIILAGTLTGLALAAPLFLICSPVLVPAAILLAGAVTGFLTSGAFGLTGLSSFSWLFNSFRQATGQEPLEYARQRVQEGIIQVGEKTKQVGEMVGEKTKQTGESIKTKAEGGGGGVGAGREVGARA